MLKLFDEYFTDASDSESGKPYALMAMAIVRYANNSVAEARRLAGESLEAIKKAKANSVYIRAFELVREAIRTTIDAEDAGAEESERRDTE